MNFYCHSSLAQQTNARKGLDGHDNCAGLHVDWLSGKPVKVALRRLAPRQCATGLSWGRATIHRVTAAQPKAPPKDLASAALPRHFSGQKLRLRGISWARSFDLEVTRWAPTRLTSSIFHPGPEESSGASTWTQAAQVRPGAISPPPNRPASLHGTTKARWNAISQVERRLRGFSLFSDLIMYSAHPCAHVPLQAAAPG